MVSVEPYTLQFYVYAIGATYVVWAVLCASLYVVWRNKRVQWGMRPMLASVVCLVVGEILLMIVNAIDIRLGTVLFMHGAMASGIGVNVVRAYGAKNRLEGNEQRAEAMERTPVTWPHNANYSYRGTRDTVSAVDDNDRSGESGRRTADVLQHKTMEENTRTVSGTRLREVQELWEKKRFARASQKVSGDGGRRSNE